jgi:hypothetical protein
VLDLTSDKDERMKNVSRDGCRKWPLFSRYVSDEDPKSLNWA